MLDARLPNELLIGERHKISKSSLVIWFGHRPLYPSSDTPSIHYIPISDAFVNIGYFFLHFTNNSTLTFIGKWPVSKQNFFDRSLVSALWFSG